MKKRKDWIGLDVNYLKIKGVAFTHAARTYYDYFCKKCHNRGRISSASLYKKSKWLQSGCHRCTESSYIGEPYVLERNENGFIDNKKRILLIEYGVE